MVQKKKKLKRTSKREKQATTTTGEKQASPKRHALQMNIDMTECLIEFLEERLKESVALRMYANKYLLDQNGNHWAFIITPHLHSKGDIRYLIEDPATGEFLESNGVDQRPDQINNAKKTERKN